MNANDLQKEEKYFFTGNIFDDGNNDTVVAPTYTSKDLEEARRRGFADGRDQATKEQEEARSTRIESAVSQMREQLGSMLAAEQSRQDYYEQETLSLLLLVFKKLFPAYNKNLGFEELKNYLTETLQNQEEHAHINLHVPPDIVEDIKSFVADLKTAGSHIDCTIIGDEKLSGSACTMSWADGGALRNPDKLAAEIERAIHDILAAQGATGHDEIREENGDNL